MQTITCDECSRIIDRPGVAPACKLRSVAEGGREEGDLRDADLCCITCLRDWLEREYPARRPNFDETRELIGARLDKCVGDLRNIRPAS